MKTTNEQWITEAMDLYEASLIRYAMLFTNSEDRARDIVQDTFIKLCRQERKKVEKYVKAWLYKVCRNRSLEILRKENRMMELTDSTLIKKGGTSPSPDMQAAQNDDVQMALALVDTLPEKQQEVVRLKFQHQLSYKEISEVAEVSVTNVGFLLHTALKQLRSQMLQAREV